jgi:hypothetical protein
LRLPSVISMRQSFTPDFAAAFMALVNKSVTAFQELVALEVQSMGHQKMMLQVQQAASRITRTDADVWRDMARNTKTTAANIANATLSLSKWTGIVGAFGGLVGVAGGLFGIERLAQGVATRRQSSMGLGVGYGEKAGFDNAFGRLVNTDSFLTAINTQMHSASGKSSLFGALGPGANLNGSTADVAVRVLESARRLAKSSNPNFDVETMKAHGLDNSMSLQDFQKLRATSNDEFRDLLRRMSQNTSAFGVDSKTQLAYQNFMTTIDAAASRTHSSSVSAL